jgi:hypothetical protein
MPRLTLCFVEYCWGSDCAFVSLQLDGKNTLPSVVYFEREHQFKVCHVGIRVRHVTAKQRVAMPLGFSTRASTLQPEAVAAVLEGLRINESGFLSLPTGYGKALFACVPYIVGVVAGRPSSSSQARTIPKEYRV